jgi:hypothetical protein
MNDKVLDAIQELGAAQSPKRRSAAKRLRKMRAVEAGPELLRALEKEIQDPRTWETQYQLVMALGECDYKAALPTLEKLASGKFEATMVYVALGDALVRLSRQHEHDVLPVLRILRSSKNPMLIDGALRSMAMLRMVPETELMQEILAFVRPLQAADPLRFWVAAAAPGWEHSDLDDFLGACERSGRDDIANAAKLARARKYQKWSPL